MTVAGDDTRTHTHAHTQRPTWFRMTTLDSLGLSGESASSKGRGNDDRGADVVAADGARTPDVQAGDAVAADATPRHSAPTTANTSARTSTELLPETPSPPSMQPRPAELPSALSEILFILVCSSSQLLFATFLGDVAVLQSRLKPLIGIGDAQTPWLQGAFMLANGISVIVTGSLADLVRPKMMVNASFAWLLVWNLLGGVSLLKRIRILFFVVRAMQGLAIGVLVSTTISMLGRTYKPGKRKNRAFSVMASTAPLGFWVGALQGGALASAPHWIFWSNAIVCACVLAASVRYLPDLRPAVRVRGGGGDGSGNNASNANANSADVNRGNSNSNANDANSRNVRDANGANSAAAAAANDADSAYGSVGPVGVGSVGGLRSFDFPGAALGLTGAGCLLFGLTQGTPASWAPYTIVTVIVGVLALAAFGYVETRVARPLVPTTLWRTPGFAALAISYALGFGSYIAWQFYAIRFFLEVQKASPLTTSLYLLPNAVVGVLAAAAVSRTVHILPVHWLLIAAMVSFALGPVFFLPQSPSTTYWALSLPGITVVTLGPDLSFAAASIFITSAVPRDHQGAAGSLLVTIQNFSAAILTAVSDALGASVAGDGAELNLPSLRAIWWFNLAVSLLGAGICLLFVRIPKTAEKEHVQ